MKSNYSPIACDELPPALQRDWKKYCRSHPRGPAAFKHPKILIKRGLFIAYVGRSLEQGVLGFGTSLSSALRAFDELYATVHRPPSDPGRREIGSGRA